MKQQNYLKYKKPFLKIIIYVFLINIPYICLSILAEDNKNDIKVENFEDVFYGNDIKYEEKDFSTNQLNSFFGIDYTLENSHFKDLSIPFDSREIRNLYDDKLKQMSLKESSKLKDDFFKDKL